MTNQRQQMANWHPAAKWTRHLGCVYNPAHLCDATHNLLTANRHGLDVAINCTDRWRYMTKTVR